MTFQGEQYEEEFLLADVRVESELPNDHAHLFAAKAGLCAYFPFRGDRGRIIADQRAGEMHTGTEPTLEEVQEIVRKRCYLPIKISDAVWMAWFRISHRIVQHYGSGRVFLAGDAAHIHSPAGGQGMNTGIQDAFNLGWKLALVAGGLAGRGLLESYEAERMPVAKSVISMTDSMTRIGTSANPAVQHLRDIFMPLLTGIPFVKEKMVGRLAEVAIDYRGSAWVENHGLGPVRAGDRAPDAMLYDREARVERRIFDLLKTPGFVLLAFEGFETPKPPDGILAGLPGTVYRVTRPGRQTGPCELEDRDCRALASYGVGDEGLFILIRPDGYVGYRGENAAALAAYIERLEGAA